MTRATACLGLLLLLAVGSSTACAQVSSTELEKRVQQLLDEVDSLTRKYEGTGTGTGTGTARPPLGASVTGFQMGSVSAPQTNKLVVKASSTGLNNADVMALKWQVAELKKRLEEVIAKMEASTELEKITDSITKTPEGKKVDDSLAAMEARLLKLLEYRSGTAGPTLAADVAVSAFDRWDRVKRVLSRLFRAYVDKDGDRFLRQFSGSAAQAVTIFHNAIRDDFLRETDIIIGLELLEYRHTVNTTQVLFRWNRTSTNIASGVSRTDAANATFWFERTEDFKIIQVSGRLPFGLNDPEVQKQARTGQVNDPPALDAFGNPIKPVTPTTPPPPTPPPPPAPPMVPVANLPIVLDFFPGGVGNLAALDLDAPGSIRKVETANPLAHPPQPGEDLFVFVPLGIPVSTVTVIGVNGGAVANCAPLPGPLEAIKGLTPGSLGPATDNAPGPFFGVQTDQNNFALLRISDLALASVIFGGASPGDVNPLGTLTCP